MLSRRPLLMALPPLLMALSLLRMMLPLLLVIRLLPLISPPSPSTTMPLPPRRPTQRRHTPNLPTRQINKQPPLVLLAPEIQPQLLTQPLHPRSDLGHAPRRMVPLAHNDMQMALSPGLRVADPRLEDVLGLLDKLAVQIDRVVGHAAHGDDAEVEYDRLRDLARKEADKKKACFDQVRIPSLTPPLLELD